MKRKLLSMLLCLCLMVGVLPAASPTAQAYSTGDDYPYHVGINEFYVDEWNFYKGECTSFVAWCLNTRNGIGFTNQYLGASRWGNACDWGGVARSLGIAVDMNPAVGAVAWSNATAASPSGHVAWVSAVNGNTVTVEEYNQAVFTNGAWYGDHQFHTRTLDHSSFDGYIHIKDIGSAPLPANIRDMGTGFYATIYYPHGGKLVRADGGDGLTYTNVEIAGGEFAAVDSTNPKDIWYFERYDGDGSYKITNEFYGWCLDVAGGVAGEAINVATWHEDHGKNPQRWFITLAPSEEEKWYSLVTALEFPAYTMDVTGAETASGANVQLWTRSWDNLAQQFNIVRQDSYSRPPAPAKPGNVAVSANPRGTTVTWDAVPAPHAYDRRAYLVQVFDDRDSVVPVIETVAYDNPCTSGVVLPVGSYTARVYAINTNYAPSSPCYSSGADEVRFSMINISLSVGSAGGGAVFGDGAYLKGGTANLWAIPDDGYRFVKWINEDGSFFSDEEIITSLAVNQDAHHIAVFEPVSPTAGFVDVPAGAFYSTPVEWAVGQGITTGTSATTFSPGDACTRGQIVTFLWRAAGQPKPETTDNPFTDVKMGQYYYDAVLWAVENDITHGTSKTAFSPDTPCNRGDAVTLMWRAKNRPEAQNASPFEDVVKASYYEDAVNWAVEAGITKGTSATTFTPRDTCTRGQIVTFLYRGRNEA